MLDRLLGVFDKRLAKELGTEIAPTDPILFATALDDRGHAGETQKVFDPGPTRAIAAHGGGQTRSIDGARAGQGAEQLIVGMRLTERFDVAVPIRERPYGGGGMGGGEIDAPGGRGEHRPGI